MLKQCLVHSEDRGPFYRKQLILEHPSSACDVKVSYVRGQRSFIWSVVLRQTKGTRFPLSCSLMVVEYVQENSLLSFSFFIVETPFFDTQLFVFDCVSLFYSLSLSAALSRR